MKYFSLMWNTRKYQLRKWQDEFYLWFAWILPKRLVYWCAIRVGACATTREYSATLVPNLSMVEALQRFDNHYGLYK